MSTDNDFLPLLRRAERDRIPVEVTITGIVDNASAMTVDLRGYAGRDCVFTRNIVGVRLLSEAEPDDGLVRYDCDGDAWQKNDSDDLWYCTDPYVSEGRTWEELTRSYGPLTKTRG